MFCKRDYIPQRVEISGFTAVSAIGYCISYLAHDFFLSKVHVTCYTVGDSLPDGDFEPMQDHAVIVLVLYYKPIEKNAMVFLKAEKLFSFSDTNHLMIIT